MDTAAESVYAARQELAALEVQLDQCWDLLHQRRVRTEFGEDPGTARVGRRGGGIRVLTADRSCAQGPEH